jgi:maltose alpha-D-glucosyltransferase/alpha-amylase
VSLQWDGGPGCGFTPARPRVPVVGDGDFGCRRVNPEDQRHDPGSLLNWMERLIRRRKETPELGWGTFWVLPAGDPAVLRCAASGAARRC